MRAGEEEGEGGEWGVRSGSSERGKGKAERGGQKGWGKWSGKE